MNNYQKVEQLVSKTGCSYEDAKAALEACSWDMLDAVISLEKDGKIIKESAEKKVETAEEIPEITPEVIAADEGQKNYSRYDESSAGSTKGNGKAKVGIFQRIKNMLMNNRMVILNNSGKALKDLPILVPIIALIFFFWATISVAFSLTFGAIIKIKLLFHNYFLLKNT